MKALEIKCLGYKWRGSDRDTLMIEALDLKAGESVFLHGPSGCGKSTLISAIAGAIDIPRESVRVAGQDIGALRSGVRDQFRVNHIGLIYQIFNLIPWLDAVENVILPCSFSKRRRSHAGKDPAKTALHLLAELGIDSKHLVSKPAAELSVGQQQRVAAARALIGQPDLILADEPTSALDDDAQKAFVRLLRRECAAANTALLFVSHDRRLESCFDRSVDFQMLNQVVA